MAKKRLLITGAGGYIGSVTSYELLKKGFQIVAIDNFTTGYKEPLELLQQKFPGQLKMQNVDITSKDFGAFLRSQKGISTIIHFAASCSVDESTKNLHKYYFNNTFGTENILNAMHEAGIKDIIFSSTCAVYGEAQYLPVDEKHPTNPTNPYGHTKLMAEEIISWYAKSYRIKFAILRYFNVCGASDDGLIGDSKKPSMLLVQNAVRGALNIEPFYLTCPKVGTEDGTPIRDYINVVDLAEAHIKAFEYLQEGNESNIFNLGTGTGNSVLEILKTVEAETGVKIPLKQNPPRQGEYAKMIADINKANRVLGWKPQRALKGSIQSLVTWYKARPKGWEK